MSVREYSDVGNAYEAGRGAGDPPSDRFLVLDTPREDLLTRTVVLHLEDKQRTTFDPFDVIWSRLVLELELTEHEAAYLLGMIHDAAPEWQQLLPWRH